MENGMKQKFIIDTGCPITNMLNNPIINKMENIKPMIERYQEVNKTGIKFLGKIWVDVDYNDLKIKLEVFWTD